ncbi:lycopene beta-cyclase CrtY [Croceicoccus sp. F390]|uniref:Lycopene beta-cyclase CrtY n=1 Tax=Croceicoccus esteveae TaxID=3075597 RepID=A0ABU2ZI22_9SPHN|nr:lycopene beta-cyclase CrtY [Croceicoccus sp. F390]MDT0575057.1 lycopene beta-cyclase CrtY [Croceicoccus sp. F390]
MARPYDIAIAGGGLAGALVALALARHHPELRVALVEAGDTIGGNHIWSFFATDIAPAHRALVEPLIAARWDEGYKVVFPRFSRVLDTPYRSITSERLDAAVRAALAPEQVMTGVTVSRVAADGITLDDGSVVAAHGVIDARGIAAQDVALLRGGWQKFTGQMLTLERPHGLQRPVVMDASVVQHDGYRFVYCLPFSSHEVFVEDTYYSDTPELDLALLKQRIAEYAQGHGWTIAHVSRTETGVLPVVSGAGHTAFASVFAQGTGVAGVRAGLFQPLTSYSLPDAVRFAHELAALDDLGSAALARFSQRYAAHHWRSRRFYRTLTAMLFGAAAPKDRYKVLERFYTLDDALIERFYAGQGTFGDKARVLAGKPPVPLSAAILALAGSGAPGFLETKRQ